MEKEFQQVRDKIAAEIDHLIGLMKNCGEQTNISQKELQDAQWFLGEERAKREILENDLQNKTQYIHSLESELQQIRTSLGESQWLLDEEREKIAQLENTIKGFQERCQVAEEQLNQVRLHCQELEKYLQDTQWYLGEERSRRQQLENQKAQ